MNSIPLSLEEIARQKRCVVYDELSVGNPRYNFPNRDDAASIQNEVRYHVKNLRLLLLYFDIVLLHPGSLANAIRPYSMSVIEETLNAPEVIEMFKFGLVSLVDDTHITYPKKIITVLKNSLCIGVAASMIW